MVIVLAMCAEGSSQERRYQHHHITMDNVEILNRDSNIFERKVCEAVYIRSLRPDLNKNVGAHKLPAIYDNTIS